VVTPRAGTTASQRLLGAFNQHDAGVVDGAVAGDFTEHCDVITQAAMRNQLGLPLRLC
jgi:hypothetical protein